MLKWNVKNHNHLICEKLREKKLKKFGINLISFLKKFKTKQIFYFKCKI